MATDLGVSRDILHHLRVERGGNRPGGKPGTEFAVAIRIDDGSPQRFGHLGIASIRQLDIADDDRQVPFNHPLERCQRCPTLQRKGGVVDWRRR